MKTEGGKMIAVMSMVGLVCGPAIVATYVVTRPIIRKAQDRRLRAAVLLVVPGAERTRAVRVGAQATPVYAAYAGGPDEGKLLGVAVRVRGAGFQDTITLLYGYTFGCHCITGMHILDSRETPGLGDKIESDPRFQQSFRRLPVYLSSDRTRVTRQLQLLRPGRGHGKKAVADRYGVDAISGATISSRAVVDMLGRSMQHIVPILEQDQTRGRLSAMPRKEMGQ